MQIRLKTEVGQGAPAQAREHLGRLRERYALHDQRAARHEVAATRGGARICRVSASFQAPAVPSGQVFRVRQLDQHLGPVRAVAVAVYRGHVGQRLAEQPGGVVVSPVRLRVGCRLPGPPRRGPPGTRIGACLAPVHGQAASPVGVRRGLEGQRRRMVQRPRGRRIEAVRDGVPDERVIMLAGWSEGGPGRYHVIETRPGRGTGPATYMQVVEFSGPRTEEWVAAEQRAATDRLGPATDGIDGIVSVIRMRAADNACLVVVLADSMDVFDVASRAIMSTELLPGEDPELLGGPDRISFYRLVHADLPITEGSPA